MDAAPSPMPAAPEQEPLRSLTAMPPAAPTSAVVSLPRAGPPCYACHAPRRLVAGVALEPSLPGTTGPTRAAANPAGLELAAFKIAVASLRIAAVTCSVANPRAC
jgi:hypothetical protein